MRQLELMQPTAATSATLSNMVASRPAAAVNGGAMGGSFASTFQAVQHDVGRIPGPRQQRRPRQWQRHARSGRQQPQSRRPGPAAKKRPGRHRQRRRRSSHPPGFPQLHPALAEDTARRLGVAPEVVAAHAALESGWGQHALRNNGAGADSNNLFGLKAGSGWQGAVASAVTTEFQHGVALKKTEQFRSYPDTAQRLPRLCRSAHRQSALPGGAQHRQRCARLCPRPGPGRLCHRPRLCGQAQPAGDPAHASGRRRQQRPPATSVGELSGDRHVGRFHQPRPGHPGPDGIADRIF